MIGSWERSSTSDWHVDHIFVIFRPRQVSLQYGGAHVTWLRLMKRSDQQNTARELIVSIDDIARIEKQSDGKVAVYFKYKMEAANGALQSHTFVDDSFEAIATALSAIKPQT